MLIGVTPTNLRPSLALVTGAVWSPDRKATAIAISEGGKRATSVGSPGNRAVQSVQKIASGKYYVEIAIISPPSSGIQSFGFGNGNIDFDNNYTGGGQSIGYCSDGQVRIAGSNAGSVPNYSTGDTIAALMDFDTNSGFLTFIFRKNNSQVFSTYYNLNTVPADRYAQWSADDAGANVRFSATFAPPAGFTKL